MTILPRSARLGAEYALTDTTGRTVAVVEDGKADAARALADALAAPEGQASPELAGRCYDAILLLRDRGWIMRRAER